jgi:histidinol-phosphate aminotransferase
MLKPREAIETLPLYHPPLAGRRGMRFDFNENTTGCSPRVLQQLRSIEAEDLAKYPEREPVEARVADFLGLSPGQVLLTNGVDEAIHLICETYLEPGDEALIVVPTYSMYRIYALAAGARLVSVALGENFLFSAERVIGSLTKKTKLIAIANPNNPTGTVAASADLLAVATAAPGAAVLIDEAYFEFYGQTMLTERRPPNLFVARTFSKVYGMAGMRVGVLVGDGEQMKTLRRAASPYNVNAVALACVPAAIADQGYVETYVSEVSQSRARLEGALQAAGVQFWSSQANFVLMRVGTTKEDAAAFCGTMRHRGILVRDRSADHGCEGCVRVTLGPEEQCERLLRALQETLDKLGIAQGASRR